MDFPEELKWVQFIVIIILGLYCLNNKNEYFLNRFYALKRDCDPEIDCHMETSKSYLEGYNADKSYLHIEKSHDMIN